MQENGLETSMRVGGINFDGSRDYGCMMINDKAHAAFISSGQWSDPDKNAAYAYQIFLARNNFSAWYAVCTPQRVAKFPEVWCK